MNEYEGHWITTFTGKKFHYLNPQLEEIDIEDIAHALSLTCRFGGHCRKFYSVAQHSFEILEFITYKNYLAALLHDAAEAYIPDTPRPIKSDFPQIKEIEGIISEAILGKFGASNADWQQIKWADSKMLATEARDIMPNTHDWADLPEPRRRKLIPCSSKQAKAVFLYNFEYLMGLH